MATYSITEDKNYHWVKLITIKSDNDIDVSNNVFNITVKDQLEYFVADHIKDGSTFELEELYKKDIYPTLEIKENSIFEYQNSDDDTLIKNGIQFWVDGVSKRTMYIRVVTKGRSSSNHDGYELKNPINDEPYNSGYVGFSVASFYITLNQFERLNFNCFLLPKVVMGDPIPEQLSSVSGWHEEPHILSGAIRTDFDWNDTGLTDNLYVNNGSALSSYEYTQIPKTKYDWETELREGPAATATPLYIVKSSAYLSDWLMNQYTCDLYDSTSGNLVSAARGFDFTSANVKSYLYDEFAMTSVRLDYGLDKHSATNTVFIESNGQRVSDNLTCYEITQKIEDSSCSGMIRKNQVKLELEI